MIEVEAPRKSYTGSVESASEIPRKVLGGPIYRVEIFLVVAGQDVKHQGVVLHGAGDGTDVVEVPAEWEDTSLAHPPEGRLHADDTAEGSGDTDGASRVRAERAVTKHCCD